PSQLEPVSCLREHLHRSSEIVQCLQIIQLKRYQYIHPTLLDVVSQQNRRVTTDRKPVTVCISQPSEPVKYLAAGRKVQWTEKWVKASEYLNRCCDVFLVEQLPQSCE